ncbi:hypothetical protein GMMP15_1400014 [Candidatus Magnetomoraceae bacterium gMMP-15]
MERKNKMTAFSINSHCPNCFKKTHPAPHCSNCGFDTTQRNAANYLPEFTVFDNKYIVGRVLQSGGFSVIYTCCCHTGIANRNLAIKEFFPAQLTERKSDRLSISPLKGQKNEFHKWRNKFKDEAKKLANFRESDHVVRVVDTLETNGTNYMVMERLYGKNIEEHLGGFNSNGKAKKTLNHNEINIILNSMLEALQLLHNHEPSIFHLDLTPKNIIFPEGQPEKLKLIDFGIATFGKRRHRITTTIIPYTPSFAPPEQVYGKGKIGAPTDFYGFGAVLYTALTGQIPPPAEERIKQDRLKPLQEISPQADQAISDVIDNCLRLDYNQRPESVEEIRQMLKEKNKPTALTTILPRIVKKKVKKKSQFTGY